LYFESAEVSLIFYLQVLADRLNLLAYVIPEPFDFLFGVFPNFPLQMIINDWEKNEDQGWHGKVQCHPGLQGGGEQLIRDDEAGGTVILCDDFISSPLKWTGFEENPQVVGVSRQKNNFGFLFGFALFLQIVLLVEKGVNF